jgi:hypothetical protein
MVHTNPEFETSNLILDLEFDQHLESHKHVVNIIMGFRDMGCYSITHGTSVHTTSMLEISFYERNKRLKTGISFPQFGRGLSK